jgi:ribosomal silencing factor RsfS
MTNLAKEILSHDVSKSQSKFTELPVANSGLRGKHARSLKQTLIQDLKRANTLCSTVYCEK